MTKATDETQMVHLRLEQSLLKRLEDFRFRQRFPTRSAAIKWLLEWALSRKPVPAKGE
jgi:hypothetical protein